MALEGTVKELDVTIKKRAKEAEAFQVISTVNRMPRFLRKSACLWLCISLA